MAVIAGEAVLVPFPFRDRTGDRTRPGAVVSAQAYNQQGDLVIAAITSHPPRFASDYALLHGRAAGLVVPSTIRMLLVTLAVSRIVRVIGRLSDRDWAAVQAKVTQVFAWP